jgi:hypothetical protein
MKNPKTRIIIILTVVVLAAASFQLGNGSVQLSSARAQSGGGLYSYSATNIVGIPVGHTLRLSSGATGGSRGTDSFVTYQVTNSASEILFRSEKFPVPLGGWRYLDVSRDQLGGSDALLHQVGVQAIAEAPQGSEPFGSVLIFDAATGLPVESVSFNFERIKTQYPPD